MKRRRVLRLECETLLPDVVRLPVTWQTLDTVHLDGVWLFPVARETAAPPRPQGLGGTRNGRFPRCQWRAGFVFRVRPEPARRRFQIQRAAHYAGKSLCGQALGRFGGVSPGSLRPDRLAPVAGVGSPLRLRVRLRFAAARHPWRARTHPGHGGEASRGLVQFGFVATLASAIYARTCDSSTGSGSEPCASTTSWNLRTSNFVPSAASASRRRRMMAISPSL